MSTNLNNNEFVPPQPLNTAVLFLVFNRPNTTKQVFESIRKGKPPRLYIAADGPREDVSGDEEKVQAVRDFVMSNIDWVCDVKTLFRDQNLGCKYAVSGAITWFFEQEEMGIILEDDCLPSQSFYWFCEELLERYRYENKVMQINGTSLIPDLDMKASYYFSMYNHVWGWASWRRAWLHNDLTAINYKMEYNNIASIFNLKKEKVYWLKIYKKYYTGQIDTWCYPWLFSIWKNHGICVYPQVNLIENIGFGSDAKLSPYNCVN